jgi:aminoglycoside phosphotransferase (APT) family kinase protein
MIPQEHSAAVTRALNETFGTTVIDDITQMTKGLGSSLVYRIVVQGSPYLLRIMTRIDEWNDPRRQFICMREAAQAGIAPRMLYGGGEDGILISDFITEKSFPAPLARLELPRTLRKLHALPPFPAEFSYATMHNLFIWKFRAASPVPLPEIEEMFARYEQLCATYPRLDADMVSSHSDLKPENILFDGRHVWLIDWEAAFVNDRYFDLAVAANFVFTSDTDARSWLEHYFGREPDEYQSARFFLMRQVMHMFYATVFLLIGAAGKPVSRIEDLPSFEDFHRRIWEGEISMAGNDMKIVYGLLHWERLVRNMRTPQFDEALRIVADRNPTQENFRPLLPTAPQKN